MTTDERKLGALEISDLNELILDAQGMLLSHARANNAAGRYNSRLRAIISRIQDLRDAVESNPELP